MAAHTSARSRRKSPFRRGGRRCASHRRRATGAPTDIPCDTREWRLTQPPQSAAQSRAEAAAVRGQLSYAGSTNRSARGLSPVGATARPTQARPGHRRRAGTSEYTSTPPGTSGRRLQRSDSSGGVRLRRDLCDGRGVIDRIYVLELINRRELIPVTDSVNHPTSTRTNHPTPTRTTARANPRAAARIVVQTNTPKQRKTSRSITLLMTGARVVQREGVIGASAVKIQADAC